LQPQAEKQGVVAAHAKPSHVIDGMDASRGVLHF
jgi:hypothetical protein